MHRLGFLALGTAFGLTLSRSGAADYGFVQGMFLLENFQLYGIIGVAVVVTGVGMAAIARRGTAWSGESIRMNVKPFSRDSIVGGALFGVGWAITGMCPGPIFVNLGEGKLYALPALAGALAGAWLHGWWRSRRAG